MRRALSWLLFLALAVGLPCGIWFGRDALYSAFEKHLTRESHEQVARSAARLAVTVSGDDAERRAVLADRIETFLAASGGQPQRAQNEADETLTAVLDSDRADAAKAWIEAEAAKYARPVERRRPAAPATPPADPNSGRRAELGRDIAALKRQLSGLEEDIEALKGRKEQVIKWRRAVRHPEQLIAEDPEALQMRQKLVDLELKLAGELEYLTPTHPAVQNLYSEIAQVKSSMDRRVVIAEELKLQDIEAELRAKQARRVSVDSRIQKLSRQRADLPAPPPPAPAEEPAEVPSSLRVAVAHETVETTAMEKRVVPNADVLAMSLAGLSALCGLLGFMFGLGGAKPATVAAEELPPAAPVAMPARPAQIKRPPPLAEKPKMPEPENKVADKDIPGEAWLDLPKFPAVEKNLYTVFAPTSPAAKFYERTAMDLVERAGGSGSAALVSVASVQGGTGTSSLLANLAVPIAAIRPVVLIDLHLTAPKLHNFFSVPDTGDDITSDADLDTIAIRTPVENLRLAPLFSSESEAAVKKMKLKRRVEALLEGLPPDALVLADLAPLGRSDVFEEMAPLSSAFLLVLGPGGLPSEQAKVLKKLASKTKGKPVLQVKLTDRMQADALASEPPAAYEFALSS